MFKKLTILAVLLLVATPVFAQSVDTAWVRRYSGPSNFYNNACAIAVDDSDNVYVTGYSSQNSTDPYNYDYATIKYSPNGDTAWVSRYNGPADSDDYASALVMDGSGNVYVTGGSYGSGTGYDFATIKYYPNGGTDWVERYNGPGNDYDRASSIAVDGSGNVYVTGYSYGSGTDNDYATIKYDLNGDTAWVRRYNGPGNNSDEAYAIAVDDSGNVYLTGSSVSIGTSNDYATVKYYPNGNTAWVQRYNGPGNDYDRASSIAVDGSGNVYVTGYSYGSGTYFDYTTIKYHPNGDTAWVRRYNGPGNEDDNAVAIAVDGSGNVYVTGYSYGSGTDYDYATIKYDLDGNTAWVREYNGPGNSSDEAYAMAVDDSGNVYVTGLSIGSGTDVDYSTMKYYPNGDAAWVIRYNGPANLDDYASAVATDGSGNVYVTGGSYGSATAEDYATIKYIQFLRGDANSDKKVTISDIVYLVSYLFKKGPTPNPIQSGDANCDGKVTIADIVYLVSYLFKHGPLPCQ